MIFENIEVGNKISIPSSRTHDGWHIMVVAKVTPTMVVTEKGDKYNRKTGRLVGEKNTWSVTTAVPYKQEHSLANIRNNRAFKVMTNIDAMYKKSYIKNLKKLSDSELEFLETSVEVILELLNKEV